MATAQLPNTSQVSCVPIALKPPTEMNILERYLATGALPPAHGEGAINCRGTLSRKVPKKIHGSRNVKDRLAPKLNPKPTHVSPLRVQIANQPLPTPEAPSLSDVTVTPKPLSTRGKSNTNGVAKPSVPSRIVQFTPTVKLQPFKIPKKLRSQPEIEVTHSKLLRLDWRNGRVSKAQLKDEIRRRTKRATLLRALIEEEEEEIRVLKRLLKAGQEA